MSCGRQMNEFEKEVVILLVGLILLPHRFHMAARGIYAVRGEPVDVATVLTLLSPDLAGQIANRKAFYKARAPTRATRNQRNPKEILSRILRSQDAVLVRDHIIHVSTKGVHGDLSSCPAAGQSGLKLLVKRYMHIISYYNIYDIHIKTRLFLYYLLYRVCFSLNVFRWRSTGAWWTSWSVWTVRSTSWWTGAHLYLPQTKMDAVVLPEETKALITTTVQSLSLFKKSKQQFKLDETISSSGLVMLFYGDSGTGKTMTANAIANLLGKKLLLINFPSLGGEQAPTPTEWTFRAITMMIMLTYGYFMLLLAICMAMYGLFSCFVAI